MLAREPEDIQKAGRSLGCLSILTLLVFCGLCVLQWYLQGHYAQMLERAHAYITQYQGAQFKNYQGWLFSRIPPFFAHYQVTNPLFWVPAAALVGLIFAWRLYLRGRLSRWQFAATLVTLTCTDLALFASSVVPQVSLSNYPVYPPVPLLSQAQKEPELHRLYRWMPNDPLTLADNVCGVYEISSALGYESLIPENLQSLPCVTNGVFNSLLDLQNVKYLLTDGSAPLPEHRFELLDERYGTKLFLNKTCLPRLNFYTNWEVIPDRPQMLARLSATNFVPRAEVFLERAPDAVLSGQATQATFSPATLECRSYHNQKVEVEVRNAAPGILLLADTWYPGWRVRVDGQAAPLLRADYILKAVYLAPGYHRVEFDFKPLSFRIGATISSATVLTVLGLALFLWRKSNREAAPAN